MNVLNVLNANTGESLGEIEDIKEVNITSESKIDYARDKHNNIITRVVHNPTYTLTFNADIPISKEDFDMFFDIDESNKPDAYDIQYVKIVQARRHKKKKNK